MIHLIPVPDANGVPQLWVNATHLVSVMPVYKGGATGVVVEAELKMEGIPLQRVRLGEHSDKATAEGAFRRWLDLLQRPEQ